jgi:hypothetical protein
MIRPFAVSSGGTVQGGYALSVPGNHAAATALLMGANVQVDVYRLDGRSYTLTIPLPDASYSIPANDHAWFPTPNFHDPLSYQGSATADHGGIVTEVYFSVLGENDGGAGNPAGPALVTDTGDPVKVKFHATGDGLGFGGSWSPTQTVSDDSP